MRIFLPFLSWAQYSKTPFFHTEKGGDQLGHVLICQEKILLELAQHLSISWNRSAAGLHRASPSTSLNK